MLARFQRRWAFYLAMAATVAVIAIVVSTATRWYGRPFPSLLVDAEGVVSSLGLPHWEGFRKGLEFPDRLVSIDDVSVADLRGPERAAALDQAVTDPGKTEINLCFDKGRSPGTIVCADLPIRPFEPLAWWLFGGFPFLIGAMFVGAGLVAVFASPKGPLSRAFAFTSLWYAAFLLTVFDYHTTRQAVPFFHIADAMAPIGCFTLPLRVPDDVAAFRRRPWLSYSGYVPGGLLAFALVYGHAAHGDTVFLRKNVCGLLLATSCIFFVLAMIFRFLRAEGRRREAMRAFVAATVVAHAPVGFAWLFTITGGLGSTILFCALPAFALPPLAATVAFIRHNWAESSRVLPRAPTHIALACAAAVIGTLGGAALVSWFGDVPFRIALLATAVGAAVTATLVGLSQNLGDRGLFSARAEYKPTVEQLSTELTALTSPEQVANAIERTVRRWLPCEEVSFRLSDSDHVSWPEHMESGKRAIVSRRSELYIDVMFDGALLGVLHVSGKPGGALFTSEDVDLLRTIANLAALALAHAQSYAELETRRREQAAAWSNERVALVETLAAEIAHEIRYPINFFKSVFERGKESLDGEDIDIGFEEVNRLERMVLDLRKQSNASRLDCRYVSLEELFNKVEVLLRDRLAGRKLVIERSGPSFVRCDPDRMTQVLVNLVSNALDAVGPEGEVGLCWAGASANKGVLTVWDTGAGFPCEPAKLFAPLFTTKPRGTGLGLAISHRIVRAHGWNIDAERRDGVTRFVIAIPRTDIHESPPPLAA